MRAARARLVSRTRLPTYVLLCAFLAPSARAEEPAPTQQLQALRDAVEHAEFVRAQSDALNLLARDDLSAKQRNDALEFLAISQIAARDEGGAQVSLQELFKRDPAHTLTIRDPGPQVEAAFARAHTATPPVPRVPVEAQAVRDGHGRTRIDVALGEGHDAVETVDVFATGAEESIHLVAELGSGERVALTLPALSPELLARPDAKLALYVEARAPSGYVLGRDGTREAPLQVRLNPPQERAERRQWWVWTSVAIAIAGAAIGGAIAAH